MVAQVGQEATPPRLNTMGEVALLTSVPLVVGNNKAGVPAAACVLIVTLPLVEPGSEKPYGMY